MARDILNQEKHKSHRQDLSPRANSLRMKTIILSLLLSQFASAQTPELEIKKMAGCYEVSFNFKETVLRDTDYPIRSPDYLESGLEWVEIDRESPGRIDLQHVLLTAMGPIKHWRQEWTKAPTHIWDFKGRTNFFDTKSSLLWTKRATDGDPLGWGQRVVQVDDSPRYDCVARWETLPDKTYWECEAPGPLPRREFSVRSDYDIVQRRNRHYGNAQGWMHEQANLKIQSQGPQVVAEEVGLNTYKKVPDVRCDESRQWWKSNKKVWNFIQTEWTVLLSQRDSLTLKTEVNGEPIWRTLSLWAKEHRAVHLTDVHRRQVQRIIKSFIE